MFSLVRFTNLANRLPVDRSPLDESVREIQTPADFKEVGLTLCQFKFPSKDAPELLWMPAKEGITAAAMFPGYAGAVEFMNEKSLWRIPRL
jgi:hypothetical protein